MAAGVGRVVAAMRDPFPQVDGAGFEKLRAAGVTVESGLLQAQARELNRGFLARIERGRPFPPPTINPWRARGAWPNAARTPRGPTRWWAACVRRVTR